MLQPSKSLVDTSWQTKLLGQLYLGQASSDPSRGVDLRPWSTENGFSRQDLEKGIELAVAQGLAKWVLAVGVAVITPRGVHRIEEEALVPAEAIRRNRTIRDRIIAHLGGLADSRPFLHYFQELLPQLGLTYSEVGINFEVLCHEGLAAWNVAQGFVEITPLGLQRYRSKPVRWDDDVQLRRTLKALGAMPRELTILSTEITKLYGIPRPRLSKWIHDGKVTEVRERGSRQAINVGSLIQHLEAKLGEGNGSA